MKNKRESGSRGEELAVEYLQKKGYRIIERNFYFEHGEIDIIAKDNGSLVFIEVKTRWSKRFGDPEESVTMWKRNLLRKTAEGYLFKHNIEDTDCRFDVIAIQYENTIPVIRHIEEAF
jgi:putative endonuclease